MVPKPETTAGNAPVPEPDPITKTETVDVNIEQGNGKVSDNVQTIKQEPKTET